MLILVKKILILYFILLAVFGPLVLLNKILIKRMYNSDAFNLSKNINTLIIGDSHAESSLDPNIIKGSISVASSAENIFFTYYKLKYFIEKNPGTIGNVVMAFSYHNISKKYQEDFIYDDIKSSFSFNKYYPYLDDVGKKRIKNSNNYILYKFKYDFGIPLMEYKNWRKFELLYNKKIDRNEILGFGGFFASEISDIDKKKINKKINLYYLDNNGNYTGYSQIMIDYLDSIARLCADNHIRLYLYNSPLHVTYRRIVPLEAYDKYDNVVKSLTDRYLCVKLFDLSRESLADSYFQDGDHLNTFGATVISSKVYKELIETK